MNELTINAGKIEITSNFDVIKEQASVIAEQYKMEVTIDNYKDAKAMATELNKMKTNLNSVVSKTVKELTQPITDFKADAKEVGEILESTRQQLLMGVKVFDDAKKLEHKTKLQSFLNFLLEENPLRPEYAQKIDITDLLSTTGLTGAGELNKKSRDGIEAKITACLNEQNAYDLEQEKIKAQKEKEIQSAVDARLEREREKEIKRMEHKHQTQLQEIQEAKPTVDKRPPEHRGQDATPFDAPTPTPTPDADGKSVYEITLSFKIKAKAGANPDAVLEKVLPIFLKDGVVPETKDCKEF